MVSRDAETVFCRIWIGLALGVACAGGETFAGSTAAIIVHLLSDSGPENDCGLCSGPSSLAIFSIKVGLLEFVERLDGLAKAILGQTFDLGFLQLVLPDDL